MDFAVTLQLRCEFKGRKAEFLVLHVGPSAVAQEHRNLFGRICQYRTVQRRKLVNINAVYIKPVLDQKSKHSLSLRCRRFALNHKGSTYAAVQVVYVLPGTTESKQVASAYRL